METMVRLVWGCALLIMVVIFPPRQRIRRALGLGVFARWLQNRRAPEEAAEQEEAFINVLEWLEDVSLFFTQDILSLFVSLFSCAHFMLDISRGYSEVADITFTVLSNINVEAWIKRLLASIATWTLRICSRIVDFIITTPWVPMLSATMRSGARRLMAWAYALCRCCAAMIRAIYGIVQTVRRRNVLQRWIGRL